MEETIRLILELETATTDHDTIDLTTRELLGELRDIDLESAELLTDKSIPEGSKSAEATTLGILAIAVLPAVLPQLIELLQAWVTRTDDRIVKIRSQKGERILEIEYCPDSISNKELSQMVDLVIKKHKLIK